MSVQILKLLLLLMCKRSAYVNCWPIPKYYDTLSLSLSLSKYTIAWTYSEDGLDLMLQVPKYYNHVTFVGV